MMAICLGATVFILLYQLKSESLERDEVPTKYGMNAGI